MLGALQDRLSPVALTRLDQILKNTRFEFESRISALLGNQCGQRHNRIASQTKQCFCCKGQVKEESESGMLTKEEVAREKAHWGRVLFDRYMQYLLKNPDSLSYNQYFSCLSRAQGCLTPLGHKLAAKDESSPSSSMTLTCAIAGSTCVDHSSFGVLTTVASVL